MDNIIGRLVRCGIPTKTAICLYKDFSKRGQKESLCEYVRVVEEENERL